MTRNIPILSRENRWVCPNCPATDVTYEAEPHTRFHNCPGLKGLTAPMVPEGTNCNIYAQEREDYVGEDAVQTDDDGTPIMSIVTEREDGQDCTVLAPMVGLRSEV